MVTNSNLPLMDAVARDMVGGLERLVHREVPPRGFPHIVLWCQPLPSGPAHVWYPRAVGALGAKAITGRRSRSGCAGLRRSCVASARPWTCAGWLVLRLRGVLSVFLMETRGVVGDFLRPPVGAPRRLASSAACSYPATPGLGDRHLTGARPLGASCVWA